MATINPIRVLGIEGVLKEIQKQKVQLGLRTAAGLKAAGLLLQRESQLRVPVDLGNLKASAFTRARGVGFFTSVTVGYTASYAFFVHELVKMKLKGVPRPRRLGGLGTGGKKSLYWDPQGRAQAKFLEEPARTFFPVMVATVRRFAKIK